MAFFKQTRDQLKGNSFVSHLEYANQLFKPGDKSRCEHHIQGALKAMLDFRTAKAEYIFSDEGWLYISSLTEPLKIALRMNGYQEMAGDMKRIDDYVHQVLTQRGIPYERLEDEPNQAEMKVTPPLPASRVELSRTPEAPFPEDQYLIFRLSVFIENELVVYYDYPRFDIPRGLALDYGLPIIDLVNKAQI